jgi:2-polyprenyl-3-methyl-5-hydroxy-6-metoxy-1,4-benzoquinol methylase
MSNIVKDYYNKKSDYGMNSLRKKKILELLEIKKLSEKKVLDIGCASGYLLNELKNKNNYLVGIDISEKNIEKVSSEINEALVFDIENENWPENFTNSKFDVIIMAEVIEHLFDQENFLEKIKQILKSDGFLILTTPNFLTWNNRLRMLFGNYGDKEKLYDSSHINLLSYLGLKKKLNQSGFKVIKENNIWYPNYLEKIKKILPANLFVFQSIFKIKICIN